MSNKKYNNPADHEKFVKRLYLLQEPKNYAKHNITLNTQFFIDNHLEKIIEKVNSEKFIPMSNIAKIVGVTRQVANKWVNENVFPKPQNLTRLAEAFNTTVDWLYGNHDGLTYEDEKDYKVFEKYGFSPEAYLTLSRLQKEGYDLERLMKGFSLVLSNLPEEHPYDFKPYDDESDELSFDISDDDFEDNIENSTEEPNNTSDSNSKLDIRFLDVLTNYMTSYQNGLDYSVSHESYIQLLEQLKECSNVESYKQYLKLFIKPQNPEESDETNMRIVEHELKRIKSNFIWAEWERLNQIRNSKDESAQLSSKEKHQLMLLDELRGYYRGIK